MDEYFPAGSMLRHVQSQRLVGLTYGFRGVLVGATHPVAFTGTYLHTREASTPIGRLADTGILFEQVILGTRSEADRALQVTAAKHKRVVGTIDAAAGPYPAQTPYSADDSELMLWTWAVLVDSSFVFYQLLVRHLGDADREALYRDWVRWGELFRMPAQIAPPTYRDFRSWWRGEMRSPERHLTPLAKLTAETICFRHPTPRHLVPGRELVGLLLKGTLPPPIRGMYGFVWTPAHELAFRSAVLGLRTGRISPRIARVGRCAPVFRFMADYERQRVERGRPTIAGLVAVAPGHA